MEAKTRSQLIIGAGLALTVLVYVYEQISHHTPGWGGILFLIGIVAMLKGGLDAGYLKPEQVPVEQPPTQSQPLSDTLDKMIK